MRTDSLIGSGWNEWQDILLDAFEHKLSAIREKGYPAVPTRKTLTAMFLQVKGFKVLKEDILQEAMRIIRAIKVNDSRYDTLAMMGHRFGMVENIVELKQYLQDISRSLKPEGQILLTSINIQTAIEAGQKLSQGQNIRSERCLGVPVQLQHENLIGPFFSLFRIKAETMKSQAAMTNWQCELIYHQDDDNYLARLIMPESG
jgi:hypothetical protein